MNLLRSSRAHLINGHVVALEVSHLRSVTVDLLYSFIEIWLRGHARGLWYIEQFEEDSVVVRRPRVFIRLEFQDPSDAMLFKLSPSFLHNQPTLSGERMRDMTVNLMSLGLGMASRTR